MSTPGDACEREADEVAEQVMRLPKSGHTGVAEVKENRNLNISHSSLRDASWANDAARVHDVPPLVQEVLRSTGESLDASTRAFMEPRFGHDFSGVRVHTDAKAAESARALDARAYTLGRDLVFGESQYAPGKSEGQRLLAHELTHVVQQNSGAVQTSLIQRANLTSPRMAGNPQFEDVLDNKAVIERGDTGPEVRRIQQLLVDLGFSLPVDGTSGTFGTETETAVKAFQKSHPPLAQDGRVGFATIGALDKAFPAVTLPLDRTDPWTMPCVLKILCPWNKNLVENVLPKFDIITFDSREFPTEKWNGSTWVPGTFKSGGFRSGSNMGFVNTTCEKFALVIYHEGWHAQQPSGLTGVVDVEKDAYINAEQWSISMGVPGQTFTDEVTKSKEDLRDTSGSGETIVDEAAAEKLVKQKYGGVSSVASERVLSRVGASDVRVRKADGTEVTRPAQVGESVRGAVVMTNQKKIDPKDWDCP